jgi:DNA-directed RNA polymerase subunit M/transcription elongation factor TFIIS
MSKTFSCPNCTTAIVTEDPDNTDTVQCPQCLNSYLLEYDAFEEEYRLVAEEPPQIPFREDTDRI